LHSTISEEFLNHAQNNAWSEVVVENELFLFSAPCHQEKGKQIGTPVSYIY
jgi:hypothetical protein